MLAFPKHLKKNFLKDSKKTKSKLHVKLVSAPKMQVSKLHSKGKFPPKTGERPGLG